MEVWLYSVVYNFFAAECSKFDDCQASGEKRATVSEENFCRDLTAEGIF